MCIYFKGNHYFNEEKVVTKLLCDRARTTLSPGHMGTMPRPLAYMEKSCIKIFTGDGDLNTREEALGKKMNQMLLVARYGRKELFEMVKEFPKEITF